MYCLSALECIRWAHGGSPNEAELFFHSQFERQTSSDLNLDSRENGEEKNARQREKQFAIKRPNQKQLPSWVSSIMYFVALTSSTANNSNPSIFQNNSHRISRNGRKDMKAYRGTARTSLISSISRFIHSMRYQWNCRFLRDFFLCRNAKYSRSVDFVAALNSGIVRLIFTPLINLLSVRRPTVFARHKWRCSVPLSAQRAKTFTFFARCVHLHECN